MDTNSESQVDLDDHVQADEDGQVELERAVEAEKRPRRHGSTRHRRQDAVVKGRFAGIWDFKYELLALILFGLGVFLLVAPFKISTWLLGHASRTLVFARDAVLWLVGLVLAIDKSDIGGVVLLVCAVGLIGFDIRTRVLRRHEKIEAEPLCSKCGKQTHRSRSSGYQLALGALFRVRIKRFSCSKCGHRISLWRLPRESDW